MVQGLIRPVPQFARRQRIEVIFKIRYFGVFLSFFCDLQNHRPWADPFFSIEKGTLVSGRELDRGRKECGTSEGMDPRATMGSLGTGCGGRSAFWVGAGWGPGTTGSGLGCGMEFFFAEPARGSGMMPSMATIIWIALIEVRALLCGEAG